MRILKNLSVIILMIQTFSACKNVEIPQHLYQRSWKLVEIRGFDKETLIKNNVTLNLEKNGNIASSGCLTKRVKVKWLSRERIKIQGFYDISKDCRVSNLDQYFMTTLQNVKFYHLDGHSLTLSSKDGQKIKFVAADWD